MGLGLNGGGLATARFFASHGARITITDMKSATDLAPSIEALSDISGIRFVLGTHDIQDFESADLVIKNPGVKLQGNPYLAAAKSIESDVSVFLRFNRSPVLAVTGSKGKSSTVSALHWGLTALGVPARLGGNITVSPLSFLHELKDDTPVVLELSSWQLADLRGRGLLKPRIAILTPIMPDHQNWYGGMEPYVADKKLLYADQEADTWTLCNSDDEWGPVFAAETRGRVRWYSTRKLPAGRPGAWLTEDGSGWMNPWISGTADNHTKPVQILPESVSVPGAHMRQNLLNAAQAMVLYGCDPAQTTDALARYPGIQHRLEFFHEKNGVRWFNDTAATIPEAAAAALTAFSGPVILLSGGTDKELDFRPLVAVAGKAKELLLLAGTGTDKLIPMLKDAGIPWHGPYSTLTELIDKARIFAQSGDTVLFSPGATSFGMFKNEFDRGNQFKNLVTR